MIQLLWQGYYAVFFFIFFALIFSLTFHEFGHAITAYRFGDDTAKKAGRLTLNPFPHIDPFGLLMVVFIGFGFAKPVPVDPRKFNSFWAELFVAAAGPAMNLLLAVVVINIYAFGLAQGWLLFASESAEFFFTYLALINLLLMVFNLLPIGALDGHYILPYFLPRDIARRYFVFNEKYGNWFLLALVALSLAGIPIFQYLWIFGQKLLTMIIFVS
jgi:Zn-dependent protease